jgi:ribosomal protein S12 methylthiotransferase accessory factor
MDHEIPAILSILIDPFDESPAFVFAASAHLCPEVAIRKSLEELAHTRRLAVQLKNEPLPLTRKQDVHVKLYTDHANRYALEFLTTSNQWMDFKELQDLSSATSAEDLSIVSERIASVGSKPLLVDLTTPDIRELGLAVVRAVIPGFHPLFMGHDLRALGGLRLWNVPQLIGYAGITATSGDNPWPHPFP